METVLAQVGNYGFPMVVAVFLLVRVERKLDELTLAINSLRQAFSGPPPARD